MIPDFMPYDFEDEDCYGSPYPTEDYDEDAAYDEARDRRWEEDPQ